MVYDEAVIEEGLCEHLENTGIKYQRQFRCSAGIVDVITWDAIYEVKHNLTRDGLIRAVGQLVLYSACIDTHKKKIVVTNAFNCSKGILDVLGRVGVYLYTLFDGDLL